MVEKKYTYIIYERQEKIATITFNRPEVFNAITDGLLKEMCDALQDAEFDDSISVIVITGSGESAFCAGADISMIQHLSPIEARSFSLSMHEHTKYMERIEKPIVAKIKGFCLGGGLEIAMACDFRIASDKATFAQPEVNLAVIPGGGGTQRLTRLIGRSKSMELNMLGDQISANEAYRLGLVNKVVPTEELDKTVDECIQKLLSKSLVSLGIIKLAINKGIEMDLDHALYYEAECFSSALTTEDSKEGIRAFLEKRKPKFKGR